MDEKQNFHGFPEDDELTAKLQEKLANIKRKLTHASQYLSPPSPTSSSSNASTSSNPRRPVNRFLKRSESLPSPTPVTQNKLLGAATIKKPTQSIKSLSVAATCVKLESTASFSAKVSSTVPEKHAEDKCVPKTAAKMGIDEAVTGHSYLADLVPVVDKDKAIPATPKRVNKFLKTNPSKLAENSPVKVNAPPLCSPPQTHIVIAKEKTPKVINANLIRLTQPSDPMIETGIVAVEFELEKDEVPAEENFETLEAVISHHELVDNTNSVAVADLQEKDHTNSAVQDENSKTEKLIQPSTSSTRDSEPIPSGSNKGNNKQHSPAKVGRTTSTPELNFLSGQTSRSKRTIVPNKRFFSTDSVPVSTKQGLSAALVTAQIHDSKKLPPRDLSIVEKKAKSVKKRSLSDDQNVSDVKKVRKSSIDKQQKKNGTDCTGTEPHAITKVSKNTDSTSPELNGRPRRTIIPNRKFVSAEESTTTKDLQPMTKKQVEIVSKKLTDTPSVETPKKRKKSERAEQDNVISKTEIQQVIMEMCFKASAAAALDEKKHLAPVPCKVELVEAVNDSITADAPLASDKNVVKVEAPETQLNGSANTESAINGAKIEKDIPKINVDEELLDEEEARLFKGKPIFLGTCILKTVSNNSGSGDGTGIICCGICGCIKKYRLAHEKRKRGSFLCKDCVIVVNNIFQLALKARPFSCAAGPAICVGWCPLTFSPTEQFCQACFAKTCLKNLPMKDDIYFKIWRSIPPMSRGCVPTAPVVNLASPHVGKIAFVNDKGELVSTAGARKLLKQKKGATDDACSELDVNSDSESSGLPDTLLNADEDLNSARIKVIQRIGADSSSNNCENIPLRNNEPIVTLECSETDINAKSNGVSKEEMLLGRQIGQERVTTLVDPILKPDLDDIATFGFPVVVTGPSYPRKPLCFLCGSSGIEQLIFCSMCCEPFHPYCSGDDLLLDTYIARCSSKEKQLTSIGNKSDTNPEDDTATSRIVLKWTCRRCLSCKACGDNIGSKELIRCSRCQHPFHLQSCIDKLILNKVKDLETLRKVWTCDACMKCKSCSKKIESNRRVHTIQQAAAAADNSDEEDDEDESSSNVSTQRSCLMLCLDCFKQRKKGSYCPICEVCYDDNDWDSKMMECSKCNRWIHSTCENLNDEQYNILGRLPEYIEYVCRLCHSQEGPPLWFNAVQSQLVKECASALRLFEKKALGSLRRKRSSVSIDGKPSFVRNLFGEEKIKEDTVDDGLGIVKLDCTNQIHQSSSPRARVNNANADKAISYKELTSCEVKLRDFVKYPKTLQDNWYALKILGVEIVNQDYILQSVTEEIDRPRTPISTTPVKCFTPRKHVASITDSIKNFIGSIRSVWTFQRLLLEEIVDTCENEEEIEVLTNLVNEAVKETFPWFDQQVNNVIEPSLVDSDATTEVPEPEDSCCGFEDNEKQKMFTADPFTEVYWNSTDFFDDRVCVLCGEVGDFPPEICGRLLWCGANEWIHCNCAIWSSEVWEHDDGALQQVGAALNRGKILRCKVCNMRGATVSCCHNSCKNSYHFLCARNANCFLLEDKTMFCSHHNLKEGQGKDIQHDMKVGRKVFVDLDWIHKKGIKVPSHETRVFVGSLKIQKFGSIVPISVTPKDWEDSSSSLLVPRDFEAQRIFWSVDNPWRKECYIFETCIDSSGFVNKVLDIGVNIVVDHESFESKLQRGLEGINSFHQWLRIAPKYIDEESVDWLQSCSKVFYTEQVDDEVGVFKLSNNKGRSSPSSSVSSYGSFRTALNCSQSLNRNRTKKSRDTESMSTEGYESCAESLSITETPKSSKASTAQKRRRSNHKTRKTPKRRCKVTPPPPSKYESPRRRSMRNSFLQGEKNDIAQLEKEAVRNDDDSDDDSGVVEGGSSTGSCDGDRMQCRANLLNRFNESFERSISPTIQQDVTQVGEADDISITGRLSASPSDFTITGEVVSFDDQSPLQNEMFEMDSEQCAEENQHTFQKILRARLKFQIRRNDQTATLFEGSDAHSVWMHLFEEVSKFRQAHDFSQLVWPTLNKNLCDGYMERANSFRMLGITHRSVQSIIEQLPGVVTISNQHEFRYSNRPYIDVNDINRPVPVNSSGSARTEGFLGRKPHDMFGWLASRHRKVNMTCNISDDTGRSHGLPLAMRFRDLGVRSKKRFVVLHSEIHGRGLFSRCEVEKGEMLIEYAGEVIRPSLTDSRERYYESKGIGCYMFRINTQVIDATMKGNAARFINHSCEPNCEAKTIRILGKEHIIIFALRKIFKGEELTYDYKFELEENKIPCSCGAARCRGFMN